MASLKAASSADMTGYKPAPSAPPAQLNTPSIPKSGDSPGRLPTMLSSMPLNASTGDAFQRQFYGGSNVPTYRILPAQRGGTA
jgi:hypothetical protein